MPMPYTTLSRIGRDTLVRAREARPGDVTDRSGWLDHKLAELDREPINPASIADLDASHRRQAHSAGLIAAGDSALARLDGDDPAALPRLLQQLRGELEIGRASCRARVCQYV